MARLLIVCAFALFFVYISERKSVYTIGEQGVKSYIHKDRFYFFIAAIVLAVFVGLRTRGNDTYAYRQMYEATFSDSRAFNISWTTLAGAPGLQFVVACLRNIGATTQDYFMVMALFTVGTYLWFIHKYSSNIVLSVYLFITMGVYTFAMAAIKQTAAVAFLMIATDRALSGKRKSFLFWVAIAVLFHPYAFVYLIIPYLFFPPWTRRTGFLLLGSIVVALGLSFFMGGVLDATEALGFNYSANDFNGAGVNVFRVLVAWVPTVLSFLKRDALRSSNDQIANCIINASMICSMIMFIGLFGTANYFARLANYFLIFQTISLPYLIQLYRPSTQSSYKLFCVFFFFLYFYYGTNIAQGRFDYSYSFITLFDFFRQLL